MYKDIEEVRVNLDFEDFEELEIKKYNDRDLTPQDISLYKIDEITYLEEQKYPRREAFENVLSSFYQEKTMHIAYIIDGDGENISMYLGVVRDIFIGDENPSSVAENLVNNLRGNFRGSKLAEVEDKEKIRILNNIRDTSNKYALLKGIPGILEKTGDTNDFQGIDRFINATQGEKFTLLILMKRLSNKVIKNMEESLYELCNKILECKRSFQYGTNSSRSEGTNISKSAGTTETDTIGTNKSISEARGENVSTTTGKNDSTTTGTNESKTEGTNESTTTGTNESKTSGTNFSETDGTNKSETRGTNTGSTTTGRGKSTTSTERSRNNNYYYNNNDNNKTVTTTEPNTSNTNGTSWSDTNGKNWSKTTGKNDSTTTGESESRTDGRNESTTTGTNESKTIGTNESETKGTNETNTETEGTSESRSLGKSENISSGTSINDQDGNSLNISVENYNKKYQEINKYIEEKLFPMLNYAKSKGLFNVEVVVISDTKGKVKGIANTLRALASGEKNNRNSLDIKLVDEIKNSEEAKKYIGNLQLIKYDYDKKNNEELERVLSLNSYSFDENGDLYYSNSYSSNELSIITGLPQKEVLGIKVRKEIEFGLNFSENKKEKQNLITLGNLVQSGSETLKNVKLNKKDFDKHIFIAGVTGSGKTTTAQKLLLETNYPFLIIEPAKTEYRGLVNTEEFKNLLVFTLGDEDVAPFRMNPLELKGPEPEYGIKAETISSKIDMIKGAILSSFDLEAAIPQVIEDTLYYSYEKKGWNIYTNENEKYENPYDKNVDAFPTFIDILENVDEVVKNYGFDEKLKKDYIGSLKARLKTLTQGTKGAMLCSKRGVDFEDLLDRKVVFEIENIRNSSEKSFIMALILININEALKRKYKKNLKENKKDYRHITLIEEAHRLLTKFTPGDSPNKKEGVEMFADMLAEIRKYGECLIIADQIPDKLIPEVLKNTNTKIIHKIFAEDDKRSVGSTMALEKSQEEYLSNLGVGKAVVFSQGWDKALQVQVEKIDIIKDENVSDEKLRENIIKYYITHNSRAIENYDRFNDFEEAIKYNKEKMSFIEEVKIVKKSKLEDYSNKVKKSIVERIEKDELIFNDLIELYKMEGLKEEIGYEKTKEIFVNLLKIENKDILNRKENLEKHVEKNYIQNETDEKKEYIYKIYQNVKSKIDKN